MAPRHQAIVADEEYGEMEAPRVFARIPDDLFRRFKAALALNQDTMQRVIEERVREYVEAT